MDGSMVVTIASSVVPLLVEYLKVVLKGATEGGGKKIGEDAWSAAKKVYNKIKERFIITDETSSKLAELERAPENPVAQSNFRVQLEEKLAEDPEFFRQLLSLLQLADQAGVDSAFNTNVHGSVEKLVQIVNVYGNVTI